MYRGMRARVAIKSCPDYKLNRLQDALKGSLELLGGVERYFKPGRRALVKPNLLTAARPEEGITTHPNFVQAMVRILKKEGLDTAIGDSPAEHKLEIDLEKLYETTGMARVSEEEGVRLLTESKFTEEDGVIYNNWVKEFDYIISLPKFKTHSLMTLTGAVKNVFGLTPRLYRINLHKRFARPYDFAEMLVGVFKKCRPTISIVDGITAMEGNGPARGGKTKHVGLIAASEDAFALDSVLACIMGLNPCDITSTNEGRLQGLGATELKDIEFLGDDLDNFKSSGFELPRAYLPGRLPKPVLKLLSRFAEFRPKVNKSLCNGCRVCIENCPLSAIGLKDKKAEIDYRKCVDCFCCQEVCPKGAMDTKSGPLMHVLRFRSRLKELKAVMTKR